MAKGILLKLPLWHVIPAAFLFNFHCQTPPCSDTKRRLVLLPSAVLFCRQAPSLFYCQTPPCFTTKHRIGQRITWLMGLS